GGFAVTQSKEICIEPLQFPFLIGQQGSVPSPVVVPAPDGVDRPVVEDGGTAIPSAETLFVHSTLTQLLAEIDHHRVEIHACGDNHGCPPPLSILQEKI